MTQQLDSARRDLVADLEKCNSISRDAGIAFAWISGGQDGGVWEDDLIEYARLAFDCMHEALTRAIAAEAEVEALNRILGDMQQESTSYAQGYAEGETAGRNKTLTELLQNFRAMQKATDQMVLPGLEKQAMASLLHHIFGHIESRIKPKQQTPTIAAMLEEARAEEREKTKEAAAAALGGLLAKVVGLLSAPAAREVQKAIERVTK